MIKHDPIFDTDKVSEFYSKKDGVPIKYVCTSSPTEFGATAADIFYRDTPHPEFGNHYFALYRINVGTIKEPKVEMRIGGCDDVEELRFDMIQDENDDYHYSIHRHDYRPVGTSAIDGGRAYTKIVGKVLPEVTSFRVQDGEFVPYDI